MGLSYIDHEGAKLCAITGMIVGNALSLQSGTFTPYSERVEREGVLMKKFEGKFVLSEQDVPFQDKKKIGKMKQNLSTGQNVCATTRRTAVEIGNQEVCL